MKKLVFLLFAVLLLGGLYGCGSMRISSINHRDDNDLKRGDLVVATDSLHLADKRLDYDIKKQSFNIEKASYSQVGATAGLQEGIIINNHSQTQISFEIKRGNKLVLDETLLPYSRVIEKLPLGIYSVTYYEWYRGEKFQYRSFTLEITTEPVYHLQGTTYYFVLTN